MKDAYANRRGEKNVRAKVTAEIVRAIRELRAPGKDGRPQVPLRDVAARFQISVPLVSQIATGARWGHTR